MRAGLLTERVSVLHPTTTTNNVGEQVTAYEETTAIRARDVSNRQSRTNDNGEIWMPSTRVLEVRIYHDICDTDLLKWNGKQYRIIGIETDRQQRCKRLTIEEVNQ